MVQIKTLSILLLASCVIAAPLKPQPDHAIVDKDVETTPTREQLLALLGAPAPEPMNASHRHAPSIHRRTWNASVFKAAREQQHLTQAHVASQLGVSVATLASLEAGTTAINDTMAARFSRVLGI